MSPKRTNPRLAALAVVFVTLCSVTPPARAEGAQMNIELSQPGQPMTLEIGMLSANIRVIGERRDDVQLDVDAATGERRIVTPSGSKAIPSSSYKVSATEEDNVVEVNSDWRVSTVDIVARVPVGATLDLWTTNDGTIVVEGVSGEMNLRNINGPITVTGASSAVIAESINEDIEIGFASLESVSASSLTSVEGNLRVALPNRPQVQLQIDTARGEISSAFEVDVVPSAPSVTRKDEDGEVEISVENVIVANINNGGPVIRLKTLNGDIRIDKTP
ncbi:MAG: hypothetical protein AAFU65_10290 [Pseudomonadota bacterium]